MFECETIVLILCATLVLTSPVSKNETDGFTKENRHVVPVKNFHDTGGSSSATPLSTSTTDKTVKNESLSHHIIAEGGPIHQSQSSESSGYLPKTVPKLVTASKALDQTSDESVTSNDSKSKLPKTRNASVVARKGVVPSSKITARKGVGPESSLPTESTIEGIDEAVSLIGSRAKDTGAKIPILAKPAANDDEKVTTEREPIFVHPSVGVTANSATKNASNLSKSDKNSTISSTTIKLVPSTVATKISGNTTTTTTTTTMTTTTTTMTTMSSPSTKRFKAKPTVTIGEMDIDKPIPASPTKTPPLGMPRKIDYIVPVIITIMALPLLGGTTFFLYRRSRDCWDKRHYRRMDFLIDGMYNDYSWK